jgi:hypothetical protein
MPLQATSGAASYDAFGGGVPFEPTYIEQIFQTWLYTGNDSTQTITNGIDLAGKGGLVWTKQRSPNSSTNNVLIDSARGSFYLMTNSTGAQAGLGGSGLTFNSNGYAINNAFTDWNVSPNNYASWTFRKQPKFFDVVTWTGSGANRTIAHNLGSVPGCIIVKRTDTSADWQVYHRSLANTEYLVLNSANAQATGATRWNSTTATSTVFSLGTDATVNASGGTYVAYVFAHNAGGFGLTGTDNVISCGVVNVTGENTPVNLGYEPQLLIFKRLGGGTDWEIYDNMRGLDNTNQTWVRPSTRDAESFISGTAYTKPTSTGFTYSASFGGGGNYIYIAIRRPMKVPTTGTSVFSPNLTTTAQNNGTILTTGFPFDLQLIANTVNSNHKRPVTRLTGVGTLNENPFIPYLETTNTNAETTGQISRDVNNTGYRIPSMYGNNAAIYWNFRRAPGFFDVVCYTGTGANRTIAHNLGVVPEMMIVKMRSGVEDWGVYTAATGNTGSLRLNTTGTLIVQSVVWNNTSPTASVFSVGTNSMVNANGSTYVAYLFASCPGVSKVGNYTGNGSSQTINCGFTGGARFVMIKRTDSTGDWYVWDTARGIVSGNDPHLSLNTTAAEVTSNDTIDTDSTGFVVNQVAATNVNVNAATYIFLAIA